MATAATQAPVRDRSRRTAGASSAGAAQQSISATVGARHDPAAETTAAGSGQDESARGRLSVAELQYALRLARPRQLLPASSATGGDVPIAGHVAVLGAQPAIGSSTVALALADAAADAGRRVHLVEQALSCASGLTPVTGTELGADATGGWRRGRRGGVTVYRRAADWPAAVGPPRLDCGGLVIVDVPATADHTIRVPDAAALLVVFRVSVPGVARAEGLLTLLEDWGARVVAVAVGPARWPRVVVRAAGPRLTALRARGEVVSVPVDARLAVTGLSPAPLPSRLRAAGRTLLTALDLDDETYPATTDADADAAEPVAAAAAPDSAFEATGETVR